MRISITRKLKTTQINASLYPVEISRMKLNDFLKYLASLVKRVNEIPWKSRHVQLILSSIFLDFFQYLPKIYQSNNALKFFILLTELRVLCSPRQSYEKLCFATILGARFVKESMYFSAKSFFRSLSPSILTVHNNIQRILLSWMALAIIALLNQNHESSKTMCKFICLKNIFTHILSKFCSSQKFWNVLWLNCSVKH